MQIKKKKEESSLRGVVELLYYLVLICISLSPPGGRRSDLVYTPDGAKAPRSLKTHKLAV